MRYSWIGIEGLPLQMWNIHVFKVIGEACGGFLEIAEEIKNKSFLGYAKIKVKGFESGLMNPVIKILCEGEKVCLGAFSIRGPNGGKYGYRSGGITTRAVQEKNHRTSLIFSDNVMNSVRITNEGETGRNFLGNRRWNQTSEYVPPSSQARKHERGTVLGCSKSGDVDVYRVDCSSEFPEKDCTQNGFSAVPVRNGRGMVAERTQ